MRQVVILISLVLIGALGLALGERLHGEAAAEAETLTATGFILLAAYALGELFRRFRLPALLGYLGAGMLFGPSLAQIVLGSRAYAPITDAGLEGLALVNMLAVGVIGTLGGGEIRVEDLKESFGKIAAISLAMFVIVLPVVALLVLGLATYVPSLVPFLADEPLASRIAAALLFGALAVGMSPAATLALLLEVRAQGRFTSLVLGVVVFADLVLVATFLLVLALAKLIVSPEGLSTAGVLEVLPHIGAEFGWAILLGVLVGVVFIAYLRLVGRELLLFSLGTIFLTSFVASRLHAETLLAFLVGGFVVQNFSRQGHTLVHAFERIALPVFVIYFTTQAAKLDLVAVTAYLPLTLIIVGTRCGLFFYGIEAAGKLAHVDDQQRQLLRTSFFSQGGVDLVLAAMIASAIPGWGVELQTVTVATILFYVVLGPPLLARALDRAGESEAARERGAQTLEIRGARQASPTQRASLAWIETGDAALDLHLRGLREVVKEVLTELVRDTAVVRAQRRREALTTLSAAITDSLGPDGMGGDDDASIDAAALRGRLRGLHDELARGSVARSDAGLLPIDAGMITRAIERVARAEPLGSVFRIAREPGLFEPRGTRAQRTIRLGRRVRRAIFGAGMRTVPIGRLWRYHVALELPVALWGSIRAHEGEAWVGLVRHYQATWREIDALASAPRPARLHEAYAQARARAQALTIAWTEHDHALEHRLEAALEDVWRAFGDSVEAAGTLEHPAWRYRVSTRYDAAQAATAELREQLDRDLELAAGTRDALAAYAHAARFGDRLTMHVDGLARAIVHEIHASAPQLEQVLESCRRLASAESAQQRAQAARLLDMIASLGGALDRVVRDIEEPAAFVARDSVLNDALDELPARLEPTSRFPLDGAVEGSERRTVIELRAWLTQTVARELTVAVLDVRAHAAEHLSEVAASLQHARQVLEYHVMAAPGAGDRLDSSVGERVSSLVERARVELRAAATQVEQELGGHLDRVRDRGLAPLYEGRWKDVQRQLRRISEGSRPRLALAERARDRLRQDAGRVQRSLGRLRDELAAVLVERTTPEARAAYRRLLFGPASTMSDAYQRLFTSVPAESIGLVLDRPEVAMVEAGVERWLEGHGGPILVRGDRGVGKRTIIRHVANRMGGRIALRWLSLSPDLDVEGDVARELARLMGWPAAASFEALTLTLALPRALRPEANQTRQVLVVANVERLFRRTPEGLARIRRFFALVAATSGEALWIVLFAEPAARLLAPLLELEGRFPVTVTVPPMTARQLEDVLAMRHRLSGYALRFRHHAPSLHEWVRSPAAAWRTHRRTGIATYERLRQLCGGNVRQALRLWLASTELDASTGAVLVGPLGATADPLLDELPLVSRILLSALLLHGPLRREELAAVTQRQAHALDAEITHLAHLGFVALVCDSAHHEQEALVHVTTRLVAPLTQELRACNLL